jgi:hypothetical protein
MAMDDYAHSKLFAQNVRLDPVHPGEQGPR